MMKKFSLIIFTLFLALSFNAHADKYDYFKKIDVNNNQLLDKAEFAQHMQKYFNKKAITDKSLQQKKIDYGFKRRDGDSDGQLTFAEFSGQK